MSEEDEVEKYKRLFEEQKARVKDLERHNGQLKDIVAQLMTANKNLSANSSSPQSPSNTAAVAAGMSVTAGMPGNDARSVGGGGGGGGGGPRAARARPGAGRAHPNSNQNPPAPPSAGGRGRGNNNASQRGGVGGRGGGGGGGGGGGEGGSGGNGERAGQDSQGSAAPTAAMAGVAIGPGGAARSVQKPAADTPSEPDVRSDIVAMLRGASMSKDKDQLTLAIKKAEEAGLHFEANQGRRQLSRITG